HAQLVSALANTEPEVSDRALARVAAGSPQQREILARLIVSKGSLSAGTRATIWRRLMVDADALLPRLASAVADRPEYMDAARGEPLPDDRRQALVAELLAHERGDAVDSLLERLLKAPDGGGGRTAWAASVQRPELRSHVLEAARRVSNDEVRERARALLSSTGVDIDDPASVLALARIARPVHLPFLVASAHRVSGVERVRVAQDLFRLGHPIAAKMIEQASDADDPAVRVEAIVVAAADRLPGAAGLAMRHLYEGSPVREAAITAAAELEVALPPEMTDLLLSTAPPWTGLLLDGFARHEEAPAARRRVMELIRDDLVIDVDGAASWAFTGARRPDVAGCKVALTHPHPIVRARALEAWRAQMSGDGGVALVRDLEPFTKDKEFRVRVQAARTLARVRHDLARTTLVVLAKDPSEWVREAAYRGLGLQAPYHVLPVLRSGLHDVNPYVCNAARLSLLAHGIKDEAPVLFKDADDPLLGFRTRRALDRTLGVVGGDAQAWAAAIQNQ
ncbi:MAG: HEAT repeat domain-containing protein, partial [Planctomycetes bacterium]|nr:HEAT repeat domain-containing protein [Planctomycetota bacterium]